MKLKEIREMTPDELQKKERDLREDLFKLKFQHGTRSLENPARLAQLRKNIARVRTIMNEKARS